jgi:hypothetical protein
MKRYSPTGRRNHGRSLKRLLDTWDRNGSTSGPIPWQIYDDDDMMMTCSSNTYIICKNQQLTSNWSITWSILLTHRLYIASCADWLDCTIRKLLGLRSDWLSACYSDGIFTVECRHRNFNSCVQI